MGYTKEEIAGFPDEIRKQLEPHLISESSSDSSGSRNDLEHELQVRAIEYMRLQYPELERRLFAIPNGGARNAYVGKKLKDEGVLAGVWDLFLAVPKGKWGGCFIETKWGRNGLSGSQKKFMEANYEHYYFFIYKDLDTFIKKINEYLNGE